MEAQFIVQMIAWVVVAVVSVWVVNRNSAMLADQYQAKRLDELKQIRKEVMLMFYSEDTDNDEVHTARLTALVKVADKIDYAASEPWKGPEISDVPIFNHPPREE